MKSKKTNTIKFIIFIFIILVEAYIFIHVWEKEIITPSTCISEGLLQKTCKICNEIKQIAIPKSSNHNYEEVKHVSATCTENGISILECTLCKERKEEILPALGGDHTFTKWEIIEKPNIFKNGEIKYICSRCGETEIETITLDEYRKLNK